ncbi:response regulator [Paenibacillus spiritus]|uniref:Response regulator n=1 Tax=Paenibacillus spiritus TaxID=2496557 RepID=A0A5J5FYE5_9BACL|nr:response regulator [Paenibacillus spiritus]KAA8998778.1 response regulator [Paenibacillus spiritus]
MTESGGTVLYIEDNPLNMAMMHHIFRKNFPDVRLLGAETGEKGLEAVRTHRPKLVILDIGLPGIDGYEVLRRLREQEESAGIPVLAISAFAEESDISRASQADFAAYVTKPIEIRSFTRLVEELLDIR